tara:strand:+ start:90 stop:584 length:495 start_codon:yes stop_codon:yes gene_type:complete
MSEADDSAHWRRTTASRLAAVQALYQIDRDAESKHTALDIALARGAVLDDEGRTADIDRDVTTGIVKGVISADGERLDEMVDGALAEGWSLARLESLMRALLRAGVHELLNEPSVPVRVIISDYVDIAHAFYDRGEPGMVNAVLDRLARLLRPQDFEEYRAARG